MAAKLIENRAKNIARIYGGRVVPAGAIEADERGDGTLVCWYDQNNTGEFHSIEVRAASGIRYMHEDVPQWFIGAMKHLDPDSRWWKTELPGGLDEAALIVFHENRGNEKWYDHTGWGTAFSGKSALITEPYDLDAKELFCLVDFCKRADLDVDIHGRSHHYPGKTLRIEITSKGDEA
jgi:hypothetical protein